MSSAEDAWIPLVDEPIGELVADIQAQDPEIAALVDTPRRLLAFRTFAYIRVGVLLGELLVESEMPPDGSGTWVESLLESTEHRARVVDEVRAVAEEVARDVEEEAGPDEAARRRFVEFARRELET
ncbi:MAG TPA: hypothetical protein VE757_06310 [Gaiellaceae bacterium]|nr:hypothetical protein [Gaiellaceae bacterium]